jgi:DNA-binding response OmpR family regulator
MHQRTLLLIDDDNVWVGVITKFLQHHKYRVITAGNCAEGIRAVQTARPDCVMLDFNLPDMDGCEAAFAIRKDVKVRKTPIIMASNDASQEAAAYLQYQVDGFYYKLWPLERLRGMIEVTLRRVDLERGNLVHGDLRLDGEKLHVFKDSQLLTGLSQDQFKMLFLLVSKAPGRVTEDELVSHIFGESEMKDKVDAIKMLAYRLRKSLGDGLAGRIKCERNCGWQYLRPEDT